MECYIECVGARGESTLTLAPTFYRPLNGGKQAPAPQPIGAHQSHASSLCVAGAARSNTARKPHYCSRHANNIFAPKLGDAPVGLELVFCGCWFDYPLLPIRTALHGRGLVLVGGNNAVICHLHLVGVDRKLVDKHGGKVL